MTEALTVLSHRNNITSIQKCYFPKAYMNLLNANHGVFIRIKVSACSSYLCKLFWRDDLHPSFCELDESVVIFRKCRKTSIGFPTQKIARTLNYVKLDQVEVISSYVALKNVHLSIVFESVLHRRKWQENGTKLQEVIKDILKLYLIMNDSVVYLKNLKPFQRFGIYCFVIHKMSSDDSSTVGRIVSSTTVTLVNKLSLTWIEQLQNSSSNNVLLGGLDNHFETLQGIFNQNEMFSQTTEHLQVRPCRQVLLVGPPGCGKTSLVKSVAAHCGAVLLSVLSSEAYHPRPGDAESWLRQVFEEAKGLAQEGISIGGLCVLLLDEIDSLCPRRGTGGLTTHQTRVSAQLLSLLEQADEVQGLVVVATTSRPSALDPALRRPGRLETEILIGIPSESEREQILKILMSSLLGGDDDAVQLCQEVARLTPGYVGADLSLLCQDVTFTRYRRKVNESRLSIEDFCISIAHIRPSSLRGGLGVVTTSKAALSDIGGLCNVKQTLQAAVEWPLKYPKAFAKFALPHTKGVLLYGPPGCAKTSLVRALAYTLKVTFLSVSAAELYSPYVGDAEKNIVELFHRARLGAPTILFIDEIDALVGSRGDHRERGVQERVLSSLLTEMDGIGVHLDGLSKIPEVNSEVIVIAATNRPDMLDDALLRPGRFDKLLYVPPPDEVGRLDILRIFTARMPLGTCVDLQVLAGNTVLFSGADLGNLCREAALYALTEDGMQVQQVKQNHFTHVLENMHPSLSEQQIQWYSSFKK